MGIDKNEILNPQVCKIEILHTSSIDTYTYGTTRQYRAITLLTGKAWLLVYSSPGTPIFKEEGKQESAGTVFTQTVEFLYPGDSVLSREDLFSLDQMHFVVRLTFNNGLKKLIGSPDNPAQFQVTFSTEKGGYLMTFACRSAEPAFLTT